MKSRLIIKRLFDFTFSLFGIILFIPVFFIVGILIKLDSKGPIIYKAKRIGLHEKEFIFYKFRTMRPNSDNYSMDYCQKMRERNICPKFYRTTTQTCYRFECE